MEELLVRKFGSPVSTPTAYDFLQELFKIESIELVSASSLVAQINQVISGRAVRPRAIYYLEKSILSHAMLKFLPSEMAAAALLLATCSQYLVEFEKPACRRSKRVSALKKSSNGQVSSSSSSSSSLSSSSSSSAARVQQDSPSNAEGDGSSLRKSDGQPLANNETAASDNDDDDDDENDDEDEDPEIYENLDMLKQLRKIEREHRRQLLCEGGGGGNAANGKKRKVRNQRHDLFSLVEYGWLKRLNESSSSNCGGLSSNVLPTFGHDPASIIECAIIMAKEVSYSYTYIYESL
jgi:HD superfamily phosphohydrolase